MLTDQALLERYSRVGDAEAFAELVRRYAGLVYGTSLRITANHQDAEDVSQECFLELARKAGTIRSSLPGWLHKVARTRAINAVRDDATRKRYEEKTPTDPDSSEAAWADIEPFVDEALERLPERLRMPLILHYLQGMNQAQVATELGMSQPTVSRSLEKAISALREDLKKAGVITTVGALAVILTENAAISAPVEVTAAVAKIGISGIGAGAGTGTTVGVMGGAAALKAALVGTALGKVVVVSALVATTLTAGHKVLSSHQAVASVVSKEAPNGVKITSIVILNSDPISTEDVQGVMKNKVGQNLDSALLNEDTTAIQEYYRKQGYLAHVSEKLSFDSKTGVLTIPMVVYKVEKIEILGLKKNKPEVFLRKMKMKPGDIFNLKVLKEDMKTIYNTNLLEDISSPQLSSDSGTGLLKVTFKVKEKE